MMLMNEPPAVVAMLPLPTTESTGDELFRMMARNRACRASTGCSCGRGRESIDRHMT